MLRIAAASAISLAVLTALFAACSSNDASDARPSTTPAITCLPAWYTTRPLDGGPAVCTNEVAACNEGSSTGTKPSDCLDSPVVDAENGPPGSFCCDTSQSILCAGGCLCFGGDLDACAANGCYVTQSLDGERGCGNGPVLCGLGAVSTGTPPDNCGVLAGGTPIAVINVDGGFCCSYPSADASTDAAGE